MAEKRYYWLKLKEDYLNSPKIKKLRKIAGGDTYTIIYLKMQLLSISNKGIITFEGIETTFEEELALKLDEQLEDVQLTLAYLQNQNLIEVNDRDCLLVEASNNIGSECESAERVRLFRERKNNQALLGNAPVTDVLRNSISNSIYNSNSNIYKEIIDYLNEKAETNFRATSKSTQRYINARLKEKYTLDDFKKVIDKKVAEWKGKDFEQYLRPETLFGTRFESYLNQKPVAKKEFAEHKYTKEELNGLFDSLDDIDISK